MLKNIILFSILLYRKYFSLDRGVLSFALFPFLGVGVPGKICRHKPSCSQYTYESIQKYGIIQGVSLGVRRILTCHPYSSK